MENVECRMQTVRFAVWFCLIVASGTNVPALFAQQTEPLTFRVEAQVVHRELNLGVTVDLDDGGMAVPVVWNVDGKRLRLIAAEVHDLAKRARGSELQPAEVEGATFTITDVSSFGAELALPVINQPQVAMLAVGAVGKAPVVVEGPDGEDAIAVHHVGHLALTWDHRAFDGAYAAAFLAGLRDVLETRDWESEIA